MRRVLETNVSNRGASPRRGRLAKTAMYIKTVPITANVIIFFSFGFLSCL
jgi:hypothetical protein